MPLVFIWHSSRTVASRIRFRFGIEANDRKYKSYVYEMCVFHESSARARVSVSV